MLLLIIILILVFGGFGGWYDSNNNGSWGRGGSIGLGTILLICLVIYLLGGFRHF
jgi:hypothetical protein